MYKLTAAIVFGVLASPAWSQMTPVGVWRTIDDKTGEVSSEVRIAEGAGALSGRIEKLLRKDARQDEVCDKCADDRKNMLVLGMEIIRGAKKTEGREVWEDGKILDPDNGKEYTLRLAPIEGGKKLQVRGYIAFFFRTQTWIRVQ
jgi:uncharacterized protein (DUF2147 family)